jgi:hypothetical protein
MSLLLKLVGALVVGLLAFLFLTAEVLNPPAGETQEAFSREVRQAKRNVVVLRPGANRESAKREVRTAGCVWAVISVGLLYWAVADWQSRGVLGWAKIAQHFRAKRIPKYLRDSTCPHCGRANVFCACSMQYCPKCKREIMHHQVVIRGVAGLGIFVCRCHRCDHIHSI